MADDGVVVEDEEGVEFLELSVGEEGGEDEVLEEGNAEVVVDVVDDFLVAESEVVVELGVSGEEGVEVEGEVLVFFEVVEAGEEVQVVRVVEKLQGDVWLVVD